jgi:hypothetical protein
MNAAAVLRSARADGLKLAVSEAGAVKLSGSRAVVDRWMPAIASTKPDIVALLRQEALADRLAPAATAATSSGSQETVSHPSRESATPASPPDELAYLPPSAAAGARKARQELAAEAREKAEFAARLGLPKDSTPPRAITPTDAPFGLSQRLVAAVAAAERSHVQFWLSDDVILQTQPPPANTPAIQQAQLALWACREEIKMLCSLRMRPKGYSDHHWLRALIDSSRLGYNLWKNAP